MMRSRILKRVLGIVAVALLFVSGVPRSVDAQEFVLKFGTLDSPTSIIGKGQKWYLDRVEELTNGRVKFEPYWSSSLVPSRQLLDALNTGISDVSFIIPGYYPGKLPLLTVATLPTTYSDAYTFGKAMGDLVQEIPEIREQLAKWNARFLVSQPFPPYNLISREPVTSIEDMKGLKVRAFGAQAKLMERLGAVPVGIPTPEVYTSLQRGAIDAGSYPPLLIVDFKLHEVAKHFWAQPLASNTSLLAIRLATWDKLPADIQQAFDQASEENHAAYHRIVQVEGNEGSAKDALTEAGVTISPGSQAATDHINKMTAPIWEEWIQDMEGKGLPGRRVAETFSALLEKASKEVPSE
jgi:TRAP-type C4-dicarboxylate transport system substrate-binding protein